MLRTALATAVLLVLALSPASATDWSAVVTQVEKSVVWLQVGDDGGCTAFVINQEKHYLLTASHCKPSEHGVLWADNVQATVVLLDSKRDLMVLEAKNLDPSRPALKLAEKNPVIGQEIMSIGFGYALERPFFRQAHVQDDKMALPGVDGGPFVSTDTAFVGGQSGGPVVNISGEVVLIVQRGDGGTTGIGVGVETIRERVGRFFGK
jgi:S1-C subfamily serine protease